LSGCPSNISFRAAACTAGLATELKEHGADTVVEDLADLLQEDGQQDKGAP